MFGEFSKTYLEGLSTEELLSLAEDYGIEIPPNLDRVFVIGELLDAENAGDGDEREEEVVPERDMPESAPLPEQYNITFIEALIRDPLWVYVFWEIAAHQRELHEKAADFEGYCLLVRPAGDNEAAEEPFTVAVGLEDKAWYVGFSPGPAVGPLSRREYEAELCALRGGVRRGICTSRIFTLPELRLKADAGQRELSPLARLSGAEEFPILRYSDRESVVKQ